jgi:hypothetical protein
VSWGGWFSKGSRSVKEDAESSREKTRVSAISGEDDGLRKRARLAEQEKPYLKQSIDNSNFEFF